MAAASIHGDDGAIPFSKLPFVFTLSAMHWLQTLDIALFHFINGTLSNPVFDWLMPILSGGNGSMRWFVLLIVAAFIVTVCIGNTRARLCALMIFLVVALGDPLIVNIIKHAVARPRPCMVLPDVVERLGCTNSGSMPSAHAANWFAATMIVFLFYRRKLWLTLPVLLMATAVSFSRVYNGVHYPSDVLAGAILGAGYAAAFAIALQSIWNWIGKKWFPLWHERLPSLLNPESRIQNPKSEIQKSALSEIRNPKSEIEWLCLGYILIFVLPIARWIYLASGTIGLSQDEAYQWIWSKHLALSYYSKPLGIALIQFIGTHIFGDTEFGVRFFSPLFAAILSFIVLRFLAREIGARLAFWLLLIVTATPLLGIGTILMTIDPPLVLVLDVGARRRLARGATRRKNARLACRRTGDGARLFVQIQCGVSTCLLGNFLCALSDGARTIAKTRPVARVADFFALHAARRHLELATWLDYNSSCRRRRRNA